ncbi:hypothetical protein [Bifidobacterium leontopitheci]|nr:hypothetical protein [Bifidobacterium leontopitheci]
MTLHELWRSGKEARFQEELYFALLRLMTSVVKKQVIELHGRTPAEYAEDCIGEFWADKLGPTLGEDGTVIDPTPRVNAIIDKKCETDEELFAYLKTMMIKWMHGHLMAGNPLQPLSESVRRRLKDDDRFVLHGNNVWGLTGGGTSPSTAPELRLEQVAAQCPLKEYKERYGSKRAPNIGAPGEVEHLLHEVLLAAQGTLTLMDLTRIVARRKGYVVSETTVSGDGWEALMNSDGTGWGALQGVSGEDDE